MFHPIPRLLEVNLETPTRNLPLHKPCRVWHITFRSLNIGWNTLTRVSSDSLWIVILPGFCFFQGAKKLCPQCNMITSPSDLRRIYLWSVNNPYKSWILVQSGSGCRHSTKCTGGQNHLWSSARPHSCQSIKRKLQAPLNALDMSSLQVYVAAYR